MHTLTIHRGETVQTRLFSAPEKLPALVPDLELPCGGKGVCGKCRVRIAGALSAVTPQEQKLLTPAELSDGWRLGCRVTLLGDADLTLPHVGTLQNIAVGGRFPGYALHPMDGRYGIAVDIGTTTLAMRLSDLTTGQTLAEASRANPQGVVAADVIGRIESALAGGGPRLRALVSDALADMQRMVCLAAGIALETVDCTVVTGNTTMLYLLTGRSPEPLSHAPFAADCLFGYWEGATYYPPCMSAFVGADIACSVLASEMCDREETALLMDIGTNGEIALFHSGRLLCCSTAAGPAFEGGGISRGVGSIPGAIDGVRFQDGRFVCTTIDDVPATGICGSGVLDAVAALLDAGTLDETGALDEDAVELRDGVEITQEDIRKVQLAKGAIAAGVKTLVGHAGIRFSDIRTLYIAGGFGQHLNGESARKIGLIPDALLDRVAILGNASLTGATVHLLSRETLQRARQIAGMAETVPLAGRSDFADNYMQCMMLEPLE